MEGERGVWVCVCLRADSNHWWSKAGAGQVMLATALAMPCLVSRETFLTASIDADQCRDGDANHMQEFDIL